MVFSRPLNTDLVETTKTSAAQKSKERYLARTEKPPERVMESTLPDGRPVHPDFLDPRIISHAWDTYIDLTKSQHENIFLNMMTVGDMKIINYKMGPDGKQLFHVKWGGRGKEPMCSYTWEPASQLRLCEASSKMLDQYIDKPIFLKALSSAREMIVARQRMRTTCRAHTTSFVLSWRVDGGQRCRWCIILLLRGPQAWLKAHLGVEWDRMGVQAGIGQ
eukprot:CAMPEP_0174722940 /NCGR_PEP_ID=MMETSP1094-20130205/39660_1 /TAXON_ID=156173 /ORGANISM="Chrysochromulina brevifilum, Strain UTEX LB 985" /LENGTH=218 /DNA_ID=CAMNT_0015923895 /DNA_START=19 /DNA_END=674 /DNA_ORIENTATION=+